MPATLRTSIEIDSPPSRVWPLLADLRRMPQWSPNTRKVIVRGGTVGVGTKTVNLNRMQWRWWPTQSVVTSFEPERRLAFRVTENHTEWIFELQPQGDGTRTVLTETRDVTAGTTRVSRMLIDTVLGGEQRFEEGLRAGMTQTLTRIKAAAERS